MRRSAYRDNDYAFGQAILTLRSTTGLTQLELADTLHISRQSVADWEAGRKYPNAKHLQALITLLLQHRAFPAGREAEEIRALWKSSHQKVLLNEAWLTSLIDPLSGKHPEPDVDQSGREQPHRDWDDSISVPTFFGREWELNLLSEWVIDERCQVVTLLGLGGIGKSSLAVQMMHQQADRFEVVIWRSLRDTPTDDEFFTDLLQVIAPQALTDGHITRERSRLALLDHMRNTRILLVLDNLESLMEEGKSAGNFRAEGGRAVLVNAQLGLVNKPPVDIEDRLIEGGPGGSVSIRILRPQNSPTVVLPVIVYTHGGGWVFGDSQTHDRLIRELAVGAEAAVVFVNYSRSPEAKYPTVIEECYAVVKWIAGQGTAYRLRFAAHRRRWRQRRG